MNVNQLIEILMRMSNDDKFKPVTMYFDTHTSKEALANGYYVIDVDTIKIYHQNEKVHLTVDGKI